jgi:hypothetical protein
MPNTDPWYKYQSAVDCSLLDLESATSLLYDQFYSNRRCT